jgi:hypothetical protein
MPERPMSDGEVLGLLGKATPRITSATADLTRGQLRARPSPDCWSVNDILAHLRACADVWGGCIARIINEDAPTLRAVNPRTWIKETDYPDMDFARSFDWFALQRAELLMTLEGLPAEGWGRAATVTVAGAIFTRTVHFYARWLATRERAHVKQIARTAQLVCAQQAR